MREERNLQNREREVNRAVAESEPRSLADLEKTVIVAAKAIIEALYKVRY